MKRKLPTKRVLVDYTDPEGDMYEWEFAVHKFPDDLKPMDEYDGPAGIKMKIYDRDYIPKGVLGPNTITITLVGTRDSCLERIF